MTSYERLQTAVTTEHERLKHAGDDDARARLDILFDLATSAIREARDDERSRHGALDETQHLLVILGEEAGELVQEIAKALRFGLDEELKGHPLTNRERIAHEYRDLFTVYRMLVDRDVLPAVTEPNVDKMRAVFKYADYSRQLGTLR